MKPVIGTAAITLAPVTLTPPGPPHTFLGVAASLLRGVRILASSDERPAIPIAMLSAHALECILKGYISRSGDDRSVRRREVRHNLKELWSCAVEDELHVSREPPEWVNRLSDLHKYPYRLRYSEGVHGIVLPPPEPMATELAGILEQVQNQVVGSRIDFKKP